MKKRITYLCALSFAVLTFSSCSHRLVGTWDVTGYETKTQGGQAVTLNGIGTITFNSNNSGEKELRYQVFQIEREDLLPFTWQAGDKLVTISSQEGESDLNKTWIVVEDKKKYQKWKSTDGQTEVQVLELSKQ